MLSIISKQTREKTNRQGKRHTKKNKQTTTKKKRKKNKANALTKWNQLLVTEKWIVSNSEYGWYFFFWAASEFAPERKLKQKI